MDHRLLEKFFKKQCTPEEAAEVMRWFNAQEEKPNTLTAIEDYWRYFPKDMGQHPNRNVNAQLESIHHHILRHTTSSKPESMQKKYTNRSFGFVLRIAAIVTLAVLASVTLHHTFVVDTQERQPIASVTKTNPAGQKTTILLEDGTKVTLNAASTLTYPEHFTGTERTLHLQGEAFFEVAKDVHRPFTVIANGVATTALGTSFNIRAYAGGDNVSVALASGKVKVTGNAKEISHELSPGESITYDNKGNFKKEVFDDKEFLAWKEGIIYFRDASFQQIISKLERWYGVRFFTTNLPAQTWKYTGEFDNENLENILHSISYAKKFDFSIQEDTVTIEFH